MPSAFAVRRNKKSPCRITLKGDVGLAAVEDLYDALMELAADEVAVCVDCKQATHLDGSACQLLAVARESWPGGREQFQLTNLSAGLQDHLIRTGVQQVVCDD